MTIHPFIHQFKWPKIAIIVAMDNNGGIGYEGQLPWHLPSDLAWFKQNTLNQAIVMGRKTWDSLFIKPLPNRLNWVLSQTPGLTSPQSTTKPSQTELIQVENLEALSQSVESKNKEWLWVIGGASLFATFLPACEKIVLTKVNANLKCDTHFNELLEEIDKNQWVKTYTQNIQADKKNEFEHQFLIFEKLQSVL